MTEVEQLLEKIRQEGDHHSWIYDSKYACEINRSHGNWCGYVIVPNGHPCFGLHYDTISNRYDIEVHGGLTYSEEYKTKWWKIGFDTAHAGDLLMFRVSYSDNVIPRFLSLGETYKDKEYVIAETNRLAEQLEKIEEEEE